jgi:hypothetical protein
MKKALLFVLAALVGIALIAPTPAQAQTTSNVTFIVNTATVADTGITSVTITGDKAAITNWGAGFALTNIGGDYWKGVIALTKGDTVRYKIRVNGNWESNPLDPNGFSGDNRGLKVGVADTTLPVQFYNSKANGTPQYAKPWGGRTDTTTAADTVMAVYFRVNMQGFVSKPFNKNTDTVAVRGDKSGGSWGDPNFSWSPSHYLTRETSTGGFSYDGTNFWSAAIKIRKSLVGTRDSAEYKYLIGFDWGKDETSNRKFFVPVGKKDTTLAWVWYNNEKPIPPVAYSDTCVITFRTNMLTAINRGGFKIGDTVQVQSGFFGTATESGRTRNLLRQGLTNFYQYQDTVITKVGNTLDYQYYAIRNAAATRENYFNFQFAGLPTNPEAERRQIVVASKSFTVQDTVAGVLAARRQPDFENKTLLTRNVKVKWTVDMRPAYYEIKIGGKILVAGQGPDSVKVADSVFKWGVSINGPATGGTAGPLASDWATWDRGIAADTSQRKMWDDGTHGDAIARDSIYTVVFQYTTANTKGKVFKFGIRGSDNESGFGLNHLENVSDAADSMVMATQFGSINPKFYQHWDFDLKKPIFTGVEEVPGIATTFALQQNYPNPFNPSTKIEFTIPATSLVTMKVFNILGQEVATLVNETLNVGTHRVRFDATNLATGVYIYKITAGNFVSTKKMLLLK